jgi:hypothetical protein
MGCAYVRDAGLLTLWRIVAYARQGAGHSGWVVEGATTYGRMCGFVRTGGSDAGWLSVCVSRQNFRTGGRVASGTGRPGNALG